jgi:SPP1 family predicted phage head-tail adaptor
MQAGKLRHRVTIQRPVETKASFGEVRTTWETVWENVPAAIENLRGNKFFAAQQINPNVTTEITIRHRTGVTSDMRVLHENPPRSGTYDAYGIEGISPDLTLAREIKLSCKNPDRFQPPKVEEGDS